MPNILTTATKQKSTESTKYDDNTTATMKRVDVPTMTEPMSPRSTTATTSENLKENINIKRINQVVRREVAKERKKIKKEEFQRRKMKYATRPPAPPVYMAPSPIPSSFYIPYAPSTYAAPFTYAQPPYAAPVHPQTQPYAVPTHPQPPPYGTANVIFPSYTHMYRPHF
ncbi:hypothetical protein CAJAP_06955 [Camponotus japonicus]